MQQYIVIGLGRFGSSVAKTLAEKNYDVLAIDKEKDKVQKVYNIVTHAVVADSTNKDTMVTLGVRNFDVAVVSIGNDIQANILTTLILKELGVPQVIVKAQDELHGNLLSKVGADKIVYPERDMGIRVAHNLISSNVLDYLDFSPEYSIIELMATPAIVGKTLSELNFRSRYKVNVVAIKHNNRMIVSPGADQVILDNDNLIVMGRNSDLHKLQKNMY